MKYAFPLKLRFRLIAVAPRISVVDAQEKEILYVEQKVFALKEAVKVFDNSQDKKLLYTQQADQIIDFGARYYFRSANNHEIGSIQQEGMRSLVQASYAVFDKKGKHSYNIVQSNPLIGALDSLLSIIPFVDLITGFILNPTYSVATKDTNDHIITMKKKPSFFESQFDITLLKEDLSEEQEILLLLSLLMIVQLERNRG